MVFGCNFYEKYILFSSARNVYNRIVYRGITVNLYINISNECLPGLDYTTLLKKLNNYFKILFCRLVVYRISLNGLGKTKLELSFFISYFWKVFKNNLINLSTTCLKTFETRICIKYQ